MNLTNLKLARLSKGISQEKLGMLINRTKTTVSNYERGYYVPPDKVKAEIAKYLGFKVREIWE